MIGISFDLRNGRITVYEDTMAAIGHSEFNRFLLDTAGRKVSVQACSMNDEGAKRVPDEQRGKGWIVHSKALVRMVYQICGWNSQKLYNLSGTEHPSEHLVEFRLDEARDRKNNRI